MREARKLRIKEVIFCIILIFIVLFSHIVGYLDPFIKQSIKDDDKNGNYHLKTQDLPYNPSYGNFTYINNVNQTEYFFNANNKCYILAEVNHVDFTSLQLDNIDYNLSYGLNIFTKDFGNDFTFHNISINQKSIDNNYIKWLSVEPMILKEDKISVNLTENYQTKFYASGPTTILLMPNFSYNWLYLEVDNITINDIYNTSIYPEIDSGFLSYMRNQGPYLRYDLNMIPGEHQLKIKGDGSIDIKIIVNYDWDNDGLEDVEEIQKETVYDQLDPTKPNIWGFFEKTSDFYCNYNKTGNGFGYFHFYIPESYLGSKYLYISAERGEISNIIVDEDDLTLKNVKLINNQISNKNKDTPYGILRSGYHLIYYEYPQNKSVEISFTIDNKRIIVLDKYEFKDSDADGFKDHMERNNGLDIYNSDSDSDGLPDNLDPSPLNSLLLPKYNIHQIVIPHNASKNTLINMIIERPTPDYSSESSRIWNENNQTEGGFEVIIQPVLRLFGNESILRDSLVGYWKSYTDRVDSYCLVDSYDPSSYGDAIPDPENPHAEFMFVNPKPSNGTYEFDIYFPKNHPAKADNVIDLRFDFVWLVMYYNATRNIRLLHYYKFEDDVNLQSMSVREIDNINYLLGSPDSMIENQILWALTQNPELGLSDEFNVTDDIVGNGNVDYFQLVNQTLKDRENTPLSPNETEVLYIAGLQDSFDVLNKIKIQNETVVSFEINHSGEYKAYFSIYVISNAYDENNYDLENENITGENKICYSIRWRNYTEDEIDNYVQRANIQGYPVNMSIFNYNNSRILKITQLMGTDIPINNLSWTNLSNLHEKIVFWNQTYIEPVDQVIGIPMISFDENKHIYKETIDNRRWNVEKSKLIFEDYGYPASKVINNSYFEINNSYNEIINFSNQFPELSIYYNINFMAIWDDITTPMEKFNLLNTFNTFINEIPNKILTDSLYNYDLLSIMDNFEELLTIRNIHIEKRTLFLDFLGKNIIDYSNNMINLFTIKSRLKSPLTSLFEKKSRFSRFDDFTSILSDGYGAIRDFTEFFGSAKSFIGDNITLKNFLKRLVIPFGSAIMNSLKTLYGVIKFFPNAILNSKTLTFLAKYSGKIILFIQVAIEVIDVLFFDIPHLVKLAQINPFSMEFYLEVTKVIVKVGLSIVIPIILGVSGSTGIGIVVGIVASVVLWIVDWLLFRNSQEEEVVTYSPHLKISDTPGETTIELHSETKDDFKRRGSLTILDRLRLNLNIINDGDTQLYYLIRAGILNPEIPQYTSLGHQDDGVLWANINGAWGQFAYFGYFIPSESEDLLFPEMYIPQSTVDLTLAINIYVEYENPASPGTYELLCNVTDYIPLGLPVLPWTIQEFYEMTEKISKINYDYLKDSIKRDIAEYQYKEASEKLDIIRHRISYDFLEENNGDFPSNWTNLNSANCYASIIPSIAGHSKVLKLEDNSSIWGGSVHIYDDFGTYINSGTIEFWYYNRITSSKPSDFLIKLSDSITLKSITIIIGNDSNIYLSNDLKSYENIIARNWIFENSWYHFRIQFNLDNSFDLWINNIKMVSNYILPDYPNSINRLQFQTDDSVFFGGGAYYIDCIDYSWSSEYYVGRSLNCWNYSLIDINNFNLNYTNLPVRNNMRLDFGGENITINSRKGFTQVNIPLVAEGTDDPIVEAGITFLNNSNFYTDTPNFTFPLLDNLNFKIFSADPNYYGGIYYFQIDIRLYSTKELIFTDKIPFKLVFNRDLDFITSNTIYMDNISKNFYSWNISSQINIPIMDLGIGNIVYIRCRTNTTKEIKLNLYNNSEKIKSFILIPRGNLNFKERFIELKIDKNITFNKYSLQVNFYDSEYFILYNLIIINASLSGADNLIFNPINISNNGNVDEFISFKFRGVPFDFVDTSLYPNEFYSDQNQRITLAPKSSRICLFNISKPNDSIDNLFSRSILVENSLDSGIYNKYTDYFAIEGIHLLNPKNTTYNIYNEFDRGELFINFISEDNLVWSAYSLDGNDNISFSGNISIPMPSDGSHRIQIFGKNILNVPFKSQIRYFEIKSFLIQILSPQQNFYMSSYFDGVYKSTYGFEFDEYGKMPQGWEGDLPYVENLVAGHQNVLKMQNSFYLDKSITTNELFPRNFGSIEFWVRFDDLDNAYFFIDLLDSKSYTNNQIFSILAYDKFWYYKNVEGSSIPENYNLIPNVPSLQNNNWQHIRIDFRFSNAPEYLGLSYDSYIITINGISSNELNFTIPNKESSGGLTFTIKGNYPFSQTWIDAVGFSWDPNYDIGDNLEMGIPFSFNLPFDLKWIHYSVDNQNSIGILGNSTSAMPSTIGYHNITIYGTARNGTHFENTIVFIISQLELIGEKGYNISLLDPISGINLLFNRIIHEGNIFINIKDTNEDPLSFSTWNGYDLLILDEIYYELIINIVFNGSIIVGVPYNESKIQESEEYLRIFKSGNDITIYLDTTNNLIYGEFNSQSISELVIMEVIDSKGPVINLNVNGSIVDSWIGGGYDYRYYLNSEVIVDIFAMDEFSNITEISYRFFDGNWNIYTNPLIFNEDAGFDLYVSSLDAEGNYNSMKYEIRIDKTPPESNLIIEGISESDDYYIGNDGYHHLKDPSMVQFTFNATDIYLGYNYSFDSSAIEHFYMYIFYQVLPIGDPINTTQENFELYDGAFKIEKSPGTYIIYFYGVDKYGNIESLNEIRINIDSKTNFIDFIYLFTIILAIGIAVGLSSYFIIKKYKKPKSRSSDIKKSGNISKIDKIESQKSRLANILKQRLIEPETSEKDKKKKFWSKKKEHSKKSKPSKPEKHIIEKITIVKNDIIEFLKNKGGKAGLLVLYLEFGRDNIENIILDLEKNGIIKRSMGIIELKIDIGGVK